MSSLVSLLNAIKVKYQVFTPVPFLSLKVTQKVHSLLFDTYWDIERFEIMTDNYFFNSSKFYYIFIYSLSGSHRDSAVCRNLTNIERLYNYSVN